MQLPLYLLSILVILIFPFSQNDAVTLRKKLVLSGPPASVTFPLLYAMANDEFKDIAEKVEFKLWMSPDQLRAMTMSGDVDIVAMPSNVIANLYNKNVDIQLINISTWGILWMVSREKNFTSIRDFQNKEIVIPFRGDMPDIVFRIIAEKHGFDINKDFSIRYVSTPIEAMQLLITRRADHVVLAEPAISMALRITKSFPLKVVSPELYRSVSLQDEWGILFQKSNEMPQAGIAALGKSAKDRKLIESINNIYDRSLKKCKKFPSDCALQVARYIDKLSVEAISDSIQISPMRTVTAKDSKKELEYFYKKLYEKEPELIGKKMPEASFYKWPAP